MHFECPLRYSLLFLHPTLRLTFASLNETIDDFARSAYITSPPATLISSDLGPVIASRALGTLRLPRTAVLCLEQTGDLPLNHIPYQGPDCDLRVPHERAQFLPQPHHS